MNNQSIDLKCSIKEMGEEKELPNYKRVETGDYSESEQEAKHPGAILGLIMGIYPAVLIGGILLLFGVIGLRNAFKQAFPTSHPVQNERSHPDAAQNDAINPLDINTK